MEKQIDAVFYNFKYYVFPREYCELKNVEAGTVITAKRLKEELCMAPHFVYESMEDEVVTIDRPELLFPVKVNFYSREEYDAILGELVDKICPGCSRYINDGEPTLNGHHRELSLDGVCYKRQDEARYRQQANDGKFSYAERTYWFYRKLGERLNELAKCIDAGDAKKFDKICKECSRYISSPVRFVGDVKDGNYRISMEAGFGSDLYYAFHVYVAQVGEFEGNPLHDAGWTIEPCITAGTVGYSGKSKGGDRVVSVKPSAKNSDKLEIDIYTKSTTDKKRHELIWSIYTYLAYKIGESAIQRVVSDYGFTDEKDGLVTLDELAEIIAEKDGETDENSRFFPPSNTLGWEGVENPLPYRKNCEGYTVCDSLAYMAAEAGAAESYEYAVECPFAYIYVPVNEENFSSVGDVLNQYLAGEANVPEPIRDEEFQPSFKPAGVFVCFDDDGAVTGCAVDILVFEEKSFFGFMRVLAPVLSHFGARIIVVNEYGVNEYSAGYEIIPVDNKNN